MSTDISLAAESCEPVVGRLATAEGQVEVQHKANPVWRSARLNDVLCQGDLVRAGQNSRATVVLINEAVLRIDQNTTMRLDNIVEEKEERSALSLLKGAFQSFSRKPRGFEVNTPYLNGSIEGTEFVFRVEEGRSVLTVFEGTVVASNDQGSASVSGGESVAAEQGQAPQPRTVVRPRDAVQWALYYPPILATGGPEAAGISPALRQAAEELSVGRVDAARTRVDQAIEQNTDNGLAYALRAVINVAQDQREQALADARQAVTLSPDSAAAKIALSYAQQAVFDLPAARDTLQQAVQQQPGDALAWARLAELQLMLGDREQSGVSAQRAADLNPDLARTQLTKGFAALAVFKNDEARAAFERAIELDAADPLPHLGLGLARISDGELKAGTTDIEVAVGLGSNNALLRAYLGKAYFEEKRTPLDFQQFDIAKQLDPKDPTAYLYSGIAKQTVNKPVEAVQDLEKSIELNDDRAPYRSRLLLDKDRAARGTSLARAYKDLGFTQLGINESTESLSIDPSNASAHRFLSDTYRDVHRHEIARVSELLQAQLLQDININPVQPSLSTTNLNIVTIGGPATPGFNEFTPLFERNKTQLNATGFDGNNGTHGGEAVITGLYDQFSFSLGGFTYDTDGWRDNNNLQQDIYDAFAQWAVTPKLNLQAEYRHQERKNGDLAFRFNPDDFLEDKNNKYDEDISRLGLRYTPSPNSNFLLSYIHNDRNEKNKQNEPFGPYSFVSDVNEDRDGSQTEGQYIYQKDRYNIIVGGSYSDSDIKAKEFFDFLDVDGTSLGSFEDVIKDQLKHTRSYVYSNFDVVDSMLWTLGASYDDFKEDPVDETSFNPKLGLQWSIRDDLVLRAAAFKVLKPALVNNRTIEPTQVAGFNQFFDDINGTKSKRYGVGLDWRARQNLSGGGEMTWRHIDEPNLVDTDTGVDWITESADEQHHRLYLYWTPMSQIGVNTEIVYDRYKSERGMNTEFGARPEKVTTVSLPIQVSYFRPSGLFATLGGTYVDQDVNRSDFAVQEIGQEEGEDNFFLVDASIGYRFPKRRGIASIGVKNLFDQDFMYQDDSYREFSNEATVGSYIPDRLFVARLTLSF